MQSGESNDAEQCFAIRRLHLEWSQFVGELGTFISRYAVAVLSQCWLSCQKLPLLQHNYRTASPSCYATSFFIGQHLLDYFYSSKANQNKKERSADATRRRQSAMCEPRAV